MKFEEKRAGCLYEKFNCKVRSSSYADWGIWIFLDGSDESDLLFNKPYQHVTAQWKKNLLDNSKILEKIPYLQVKSRLLWVSFLNVLLLQGKWNEKFK